MAEHIVNVDGLDFHFDLSKLSGDQVILLRMIGVSPASLTALVEKGEASADDLPEIVGLMVVALHQADMPADPTWLAKQITVESDIAFRSPEAAPPTDDEIAAAAAVLARA